jgi:hypothetical protein
MKRLIKKILKEDRRQMFIDKIIQVMNNDFPLIKNIKDYGFYEQLSEDELNYVLSGIFGEPVRYRYGGIIDKNGKEIYYESSIGEWRKTKYDDRGNKIHEENSYGEWEKSEFDENNNRTYLEYSDGYWEKNKYDENGKVIYSENSYGEILDNR